MKRGATGHPKMHHLAELLECSRFEAIGIMTLLWEWTGDYAIQGDIGKFTNAQIARAIGCADGDKLVRALIDAKFVDEHEEYRLIVHDWHEHCESYVRKRLERLGLQCVSQRQPTAANGGQRQPLAANGRQRRPRARAKAKAKARAKASSEGGTGETIDAQLPAPLDTEPFRAAWAEWIAHRREIGKPMTDRATGMLIKKLTEIGHDRAIAAIEHSIANGWQGVFEPDRDRSIGASRNTGGHAEERRAAKRGREHGDGEIDISDIRRIGA